MGLNGVAVLGLRLLPKMPIGYIDLRYGGWRQRVLVTVLDQHPLALSISVIENDENAFANEMNTSGCSSLNLICT